MSIEKAIIIKPEGISRLTAEDYSKIYGHNACDIQIQCPCCGEPVIIAAIPSVRRHPYYRHKDTDDGFDCPLLEKNEDRFKHLNPQNLNECQAAFFREQFYKDENIKRSFNFMGEICGATIFRKTNFNNCMKIADGKNIWAYSGIQLWVIPYILLTLERYTATSRIGKPYSFHFHFEKPKRSPLDDIWLTPAKCKLAKVYYGTGTLAYSTHENPLPLSEAKYLEKSKNIGWIDSITLADIKKTF